MKKIPCLFERTFENHRPTLTKNVGDGCEWVFEGIGIATVKYDGTACAVIDGKLYARYDCKPNKKARKNHEKGTDWSFSDFPTPPDGSISCQEADFITGHFPHWVLVDGQPNYKYHEVAFDNNLDGTYELMGEKINGNKSNFVGHILIRHGQNIVEVERTFDGIKKWLEEHSEEGIVFHAPDGRMCKIRRRDYGLSW